MKNAGTLKTCEQHGGKADRQVAMDDVTKMNHMR